MTSDGAWLIDKPVGVTSFGVIDQIKRGLAQAAGVRMRDLPALGHGGTLDPFATGLLVVFVGRATRLAQCYLGGEKTYTGTVRFGATTISGDLTDPELPTPDTQRSLPENRDRIQEAASEWIGAEYDQLPPMHSAKRVEGQRLYHLARQGLEIERPTKRVQVSEFEITSYPSPEATFRVTVSSGTYIRVLAQDLGKRLGTLAYLTSLRRVATGGWTLASAVTLPDLLAAVGAQEGQKTQVVQQALGFDFSATPGFVPWDALLQHTLQAEATADEEADLFQGRQRALFELAQRVSAGHANGPSVGPSIGREMTWVALRNQGSLFGLARRIEGGRLQLERLFPKHPRS